MVDVQVDSHPLMIAAASFCRELCDHQKVEIDFHSSDVPEKLPEEISLCLFRVLREALQNAIRHCGSKRFEVWLSCISNQIQLTVRDSRIGFDPEEAFGGRGLGLTSMRERKLVDGKLTAPRVRHANSQLSASSCRTAFAQAARYNLCPSIFWDRVAA